MSSAEESAVLPATRSQYHRRGWPSEWFESRLGEPCYGELGDLVLFDGGAVDVDTDAGTLGDPDHAIDVRERVDEEFVGGLMASTLDAAVVGGGGTGELEHGSRGNSEGVSGTKRGSDATGFRDGSTFASQGQATDALDVDDRVGSDTAANESHHVGGCFDGTRNGHGDGRLASQGSDFVHASALEWIEEEDKRLIFEATAEFLGLLHVVALAAVEPEFDSIADRIEEGSDNVLVVGHAARGREGLPMESLVGHLARELQDLFDRAAMKAHAERDSAPVLAPKDAAQRQVGNPSDEIPRGHLDGGLKGSRAKRFLSQELLHVVDASPGENREKHVAPCRKLEGLQETTASPQPTSPESVTNRITRERMDGSVVSDSRSTRKSSRSLIVMSEVLGAG